MTDYDEMDDVREFADLSAFYRFLKLVLAIVVSVGIIVYFNS